MSNEFFTKMFYFFVALFLSTIVNGALVKRDEIPKLLVVSYDAFRSDYFDRDLTPYMNKLRKSGAFADYISSVFVTKTFPNHQSIATGLYAETHGVVDNSFYDKELNKTVKISAELFAYGNALPIWTVNEQSGKRSGAMMWPGSIYPYQNVTPTFVQRHNESISYEDRIDALISWFTDKTRPINFGLLYIEDPDHHGHPYGTNSPRFNEVLKRVDNVTKYLHRKLEDAELSDTINVVHLSDHGMTNVKYENIINLTRYLNSSDYIVAGSAPNLQIFPKPGKEEEIYNTLKKASKEKGQFEVYKKKEIPEQFHYSKNPRIAPILLSAKVGYTFDSLYKDIEWYKKEFNITVTNSSEFGVHGYDNKLEEMRPMFFASGPAFMSNCKFKPFDNIDLYPLFCEILELKCPPNNGSLEHLKDCLNFSEDERLVDSYVLYFGIIAAVVLFGIGAMAFKKHQDAKAAYRKILNVQETENCWDEKYENENVPY